MWRTWGAIPSTPFASRARRCSTPKRCCSSTTQRPRRAKRTVGSISAWVPKISPSSPLASWFRACAAGRRRRRPGEQRERDRLFGEQPAEGDRVLLGERLGRRHQHRLVAGFQRPQHRVDGDHGLARADLAHQQPLHRLAASRGRRRSSSKALQLVAGRLEGQRVEPAADQVAGLAEARRRAGACGGCACGWRAGPGGGRALRRRGARGRVRARPRTRGSGRPSARRRLPARWRRARSSAGSPSIAFGEPARPPARPSRGSVWRRRFSVDGVDGTSSPSGASDSSSRPSPPRTSSHSLTAKPLSERLPVSRRLGAGDRASTRPRAG